MVNIIVTIVDNSTFSFNKCNFGFRPGFKKQKPKFFKFC